MSKKIERVGVYISGPMSGLPNENKETFNVIEMLLKEKGFKKIFNPAQEGEGDPTTYKELLWMDLGWIKDHADIVIMLPGYEKSIGASVELAWAIALGLKIYYLGNFLDSIIEKIDRIKTDYSGEIRSL